MADVIKMVRPKPVNDNGEKDAVREALYGYLIGKDVDAEKLPPVVQRLRGVQEGRGGERVPDVPFEMLTALELTKEHWSAIAKTMTWTQTRMNLNTLQRKGVLEDEAMVTLVAERLKSPEAIRRARAFPYQLLAAFRAAGADMPGAITGALQDALEVATENVPSIAGKTLRLPGRVGLDAEPGHGSP